MTLARLITALNQAGIEPDPMAVLDALWIATKATPSFIESAPAGQSPLNRKAGQDDLVVVDRPAMPPIDLPEPTSHPSPIVTPGPPITFRDSNLFSNAQFGGVGRLASPLATPSASALPQRLAFMRAVRPLKQRWRSARAFDIDEEATAHLTAECQLSGRRVLMPVLRHRQERWFDVDLVLEDDDAVELWRDTLMALAQALRDTGAFRLVRAWRLRITAEQTPPGRLGERLEAASGGLHPTTALTGAERRLVLFAHHSSSIHWKSGTYARVLKAWASEAPVALLCLLPSESWVRTPLGEPDGCCATYRPGVSNRLLEVQENWWSPKAGDRTAIAYPMVEFTPNAVGDWAAMLMARGRAMPITMQGALARKADRSTAADPAAEAQRRVDLLQEASPGAFGLASLLCTSPFTIPVVRLIQEAHLGRVDLAELSELFVSGLIVAKRSKSGASTGWFEILPAARTLLLRCLRGADSRAIATALVQRVSEHIRMRTGIAPEATSFVLDAEGRYALPAWAEPYAIVAAALRPTPPEPDPLAVLAALQTARARTIKALARLAALDSLPPDAALDPTMRELIDTGRLAPAADGGSRRFPDIVRAKLFQIDKAQPLLGARILWVDDRPANNTRFREAFEVEGAAVVEVLDTQKALARARDGFDIILSDMGRPEGEREGIALIKKLRSEGLTTPVIIFAGGYATARSRREQAIQAGAYGCTNDVGELRALVHGLFGDLAVEGALRSTESFRSPTRDDEPEDDLSRLFDHSRDMAVIVHPAGEDSIYARSAAAFAALLRDRLDVPAARIRRHALGFDASEDLAQVLLKDLQSLDLQRQGTAFLYVAGVAIGPDGRTLAGPASDFPISEFAHHLRSDGRFTQVIMIAEGTPHRLSHFVTPSPFPQRSVLSQKPPSPYLSVISSDRDIKALNFSQERDPLVLPVVRRLIEIVEALGEGHILLGEDIVEPLRNFDPGVEIEMDPYRGISLGVGPPAPPVLRPWSVYFAYGVEQANQRLEHSDARALEAYERALLFAPDNLPDDVRAQITVYAGAMMKRLERLEDAESLLIGAEPLWLASRWRDDAVYNLAGVYAMRGKRTAMLRLLRDLPKSSPILDRVRRALRTYFRRYADDPEFLNLLPRGPERRK